MSDRTHFVYTAWDSAGRPLYVGCTRRPKGRQQDHRTWAEWYQYAERFTMTGPYPEHVALDLERERIRSIRPHFNWLPEYAAQIRGHARRLSALIDQICATRGINSDDRGQWEAWCDASDEARAIADAEFDIRITSGGRLRAYEQIRAAELVAA